MTAEQATSAPAHEMRWYMTGHSTHFLGAGIQSVLVSWLVTIVLHETPERVGLAQSLTMLPMIVLLLAGGATADRVELRGFLLRLQLMFAVPYLALAAIIATDNLVYWLVVAQVLSTSAMAAWLMPTRDSILTRIALRQDAAKLGAAAIPHAVAMATSIQFSGQVAGMLLASFADSVSLMMTGAVGAMGAIPFLCLQAAGALTAAFTTSRLSPAPPAQRTVQPKNRLAEMAEGMTMTFADPDIRAMTLLMGIGGIFYIGVFMVIFPLLARDAYGGGSAEISLFTAAFFGGIGASSYGLTRLPPIHRQGRAIMIAMCAGSVTMTLVHFFPPFWLTVGLVFLWGTSAGVSMSTSRAIVQARAPDSHRGRMLAAFQFAMMGGGPIGSLMSGYAVSVFGLFDTLLIPPAMMLCLWLIIFVTTDLWKAEARAPASQPAD